MNHLRTKAGLLAAPLILGFLIFYILPFGGSVVYSLFTTTRLTNFVGLTNYAEALQNSFFRLAYANTMRFSLLSVPLLVVLSILLAFLLFSLAERASFAKSAFLIPLLMPSAALVAFWDMAFIKGLGIGAVETGGTGGTGGAMIPVDLFFLWKNIGICALILTGRMMAIPKEIFEAAEMDGADKLRKHWYITLPSVVPAIFFAAIFGLVQSFKVYKEVFLLYGAYPQNSLYFMQHNVNNKFWKLDYPSLSAGSVLFAAGLLLLVAAVFGCYWLAMKRRGD